MSTMTLKTLSVLALALAAPACGSASGAPAPAGPSTPPTVTNGRFETAAPAGELEAALRSAGQGAAPVWVGYSVPMVPGRGKMCCFERNEWNGGSRMRTEEQRDDATCELEEEHGGWGSRGDERRGEQQLDVLVRLEGGKVSQVRAYSADCRLDAGGRRFVWLGAVKDEESVHLLARLSRQVETRDEKRSGDAAIAALALHRASAADTALEALAAPGSPAKQRQPPLFWMGQTRGERGARFLEKVIGDERDERGVREHAIFSLSQSRVPWAVEAITRTAHENGVAHLRSQALFWLAQMKGVDAEATILSAIEKDRDQEVRRQGVFALSQLRDGKAVPALVQLARTSRDQEVKKQALFWLAQSKDPQAAAYLDKVLND